MRQFIFCLGNLILFHMQLHIHSRQRIKQILPWTSSYRRNGQVMNSSNAYTSNYIIAFKIVFWFLIFRQIATAHGPCGNNRDYIFLLEKAMFDIGNFTCFTSPCLSSLNGFACSSGNIVCWWSQKKCFLALL